LALRDCHEATAIVRCGDQRSIEQTMRNRRDIAYVATHCTRSLDRVFAAAGAGGIRWESEAQRLLRDIHAASQHIASSRDLASTTYGKVLFGLPANPDL
jgi:hypothetical protein